MECPECGNVMTDDIFKDVICKDEQWFSVHLRSCVECGHVDDDGTWVE